MAGFEFKKFIDGFLSPNIGKIIFIAIIILIVLKGISCQPDFREAFFESEPVRTGLSQPQQEFGGCSFSRSYYIKQ